MGDKIEILERVCDNQFNDYLVRFLRDQRGWRICPDDWDIKIAADMHGTAYAKDLGEHSDTGLLLHSFNNAPQDIDDSGNYEGLNILANYVFDSVMAKSRYEYHGIELVRILWNYYNRSSTGIYHVDKDFTDMKYFSIVYHLNTCDGGTIIEKNPMIPSIAGNAIIFPSNLPHRGVGPKKDPARFVLNFILHYTKRTKK